MTTALILGAAVWETGPSPTLRRRTEHAALLFHAGEVDRIIACGGLGQHPPTEAEVMAELLRKSAVPSSAIVREDRSTNTGENIRFATALLTETDITIVTDWYHAPRARLVAKREGLSATTSCPEIDGAKLWPQLKGALREIPAYFAYLIRLKS